MTKATTQLDSLKGTLSVLQWKHKRLAAYNGRLAEFLDSQLAGGEIADPGVAATLIIAWEQWKRDNGISEDDTLQVLRGLDNDIKPEQPKGL